MPANVILSSFLAGAVAMAYSVIAFLFWRAWEDTRDRLFRLFAAAFAALGIERIVLVLLGTTNESIHLVYFVRLFAYILIIWAIVDKNRSPQR
jgi:hypothetical protein